MSDRTNGNASGVAVEKSSGVVSSPSRRRSQLLLLANVIFGSLSFFFVYLGSFPIATIQSSFNTDRGLGTASLSVQTASMVLAALFFTTLITEKVGLRRQILIGVVLEAVYVAGNIYPRWWSLVPAAFISGFGRPMLVTAQSIFIANMAVDYARLMELNADEIKSRFFTIFFSFYCSTRVIGNIVSSLILGSGIEKFSVSYIRSVIAAVNNTEVTFCGADFCESEHVWDAVYQSPNRTSSLWTSGNGTTEVAPVAVQHSKGVDAGRVYELCGFALGCHTLGFICMLLLRIPPLHVDSEGAPVSGSGSETALKTIWRCVSSTVRSWRNPKYLLLIPLSIYNGVDNAYWQADFTKSFVTCALGIHWVGFIVAWYGLSAPLTVMSFAPCNKTFFRPMRFALAFLVHTGTAAALLYWKPSVSELPVLFILSAAWGVGSGLWPCCLSILYGVVFEDDLQSAYANMILFDSLGAMASYAWSYGLCMSTKTEIVIGLLSLGILGYAAVEVLTWLERQKKAQESHLAERAECNGGSPIQMQERPQSIDDLQRNELKIT